MISVGIIDTLGFVGAVNALDTCLKTAAVQFVRFEKMSGGIVSIVIKGDVGAVTASVMAGIEAAAAVGELRNHTIIARLDDQSASLLNKSVERREQDPGSDSTAKTDSAAAPTQLESHELSKENLVPVLPPTDQDAITSSEQEAQKETKEENVIYSEEKLNLMTVSQLRKLARELSIKGISREKIKRSRKVDLIVNILVELNESTELKEEEE
ncbi:MAG: BMC domain-containing protein [Acetobacterium sp.]|nr:BMC domain-containing protein [Bacillota bacterium]MCG2730530.1 BMC domain-containing protein [Acetobacterium sp.]